MKEDRSAPDEPISSFICTPGLIRPAPRRSRAARGVDWLCLLDRQSTSANDRHALADGALHAALRFSGAPRGNVQFVDANGVLCIEAQHGFDGTFLDFFQSVHSGQAACGAAAQAGAPIIVEDVASSALFVHTPALDVMRAAGALAVTSFPILGRSGHVVGVVSVHYDKRARPSKRGLAMIESVAERTGRLL